MATIPQLGLTLNEIQNLQKTWNYNVQLIVSDNNFNQYYLN
jgi:hypothetical protein